jgi:hypothetical protein
MPLSKSTSQKMMGSNIKEMMHSFKKGGGFAKGKSPMKARQMAVAAAFKIKEVQGKKKKG